MFRRWFGVVLVLWGVLASILVSAPSALAAPSFQVSSATTIAATGLSPCAGTVTLKDDGSGNFTGGCAAGRAPGVTATWTISNVTTNGTNYTGTIAANGAATGPNGTVSIAGKAGTTLTNANPPGTGTGNNTSDKPTCDGGTLTWLICPVINFLVDVTDNIRQDILVPFLKEPPLTATTTVNGKANQPNPVYLIWAGFRDAASVFFILIFFLIIFGTAIGFDNYTVKKILPHLIAGAILMPFSFYICAIIIDIGNVLGQGLFALADQFIPPPQIDFTSPLSQLLLGGVGVVGTLAAISFATTVVAEIGLGVLFTLLFAVLAALFTLVLRKVLIIALVILSPFAILAWILPNTQRLYNLWWTNLIRLVLMYPLIMLLFEAGRVFSLTAGTLVTTGGALPSIPSLLGYAVTYNPFTSVIPIAAALGAGHALAANDFEKAAVPFLQLFGLYAPLFFSIFMFKQGGSLMRAGSGAIGRLRRGADSRYGRNSDAEKERKEMRQQRNLLNSNNQELPQWRRNIARARAGHGNGMMGFRRGNALQQIKYQQALDSAYGNAGAVSAIQRGNNGQIPQETHQQRLASEQTTASNNLTDQRAARAGVNQATGSTGQPPDLATRYNAQRETERRKQSTLAGEHESVVEGHLNPQGSRQIAGAALAAGLEEQATVRGKVTGTLGHEADLDAAAIEAESQRRIRAGGVAVTNPDEQAAITAQARRLRFQAATHGASSKTSEEMSSHYADALGRTEDDREALSEHLASAAARNGGPLNTQQIINETDAFHRQRTTTLVGAGAENTRKNLAKASGERNATVNDRTTNPLTHAQLSQSQQDVTEGKLAIDAGVVRGNIRGTQEAIEAAKRSARLQGRTLTDQQARTAVMQSGAAAYEGATRKQVLQAYGQNLGAIDNAAANPLHGDEIVRASRTTSGKALGRETGTIKGTNRAAKAEAQRSGIRNAGTDAAFQRATTTSAKATQITETEKQAEAVGQEHGTIRADGVRSVSPEDQLEDAERVTERTLGQAAGATQRRLTAAREAERIAIGSAPVTAASRAAARAQLINNAADTKGRQEYIDTQNAYVADRATMQGHERSIVNAMNNAREAGRPITRDQAEQQIYSNMRGEQERESYNAAMAQAGKAQGVMQARETQTEAVREEIAKDYGNLDAVKAGIATRTGRAVGSITDAEANRQLTSEAEEAVEMGAHNKLVKDTRDTIVKSTADEVGTVRALTQENDEAAARIQEEARRAGRVPPSDDVARTQARAEQTQRLASAKVGRTMRDTQESVNEEMATDRGGIDGEDKSIGQELSTHPELYRGMSPEASRLAARASIQQKLGSKAHREARNARLGKARDAEGVAEGRRRRASAARDELAKRRGVAKSAITDAEIEEAIEGSSYRNGVEEQANQLADSAAEGIGTRYGREDALREDAERLQQKARKAGVAVPSAETAMRQVRQATATNRFRSKLNVAESAAGKEIGQYQGEQKINEAAIDLERETTLSNAHRFANDVTIGANSEIPTAVSLAEDSQFPHDVKDTSGNTYKAGETVPANTRLAAGTTVTTGTRLKAGAILKAGTRVQRNSAAAKEVAAAGKLISRQDARRAVARKAITSGREQAERSRAQEQGQIAAYDRAAHEGTPEARERTETYEQSNLEAIATDSASVNAQSALAAEGRPMHRDMRSMVNTRTDLARTRIIRDRVAERMNERQAWAGNVRLSEVDLSSGSSTGNVPKMGEMTSEALQARQLDRAIAYTSRLVKSDEGNTEVRKRAQRRVRDGGVGRTWNRSVDQSADPELELDTYWAEGAAAAGHVDSGRPMIAGAHNPKATSFNSKDGISNGDAQAMLDYYNLDDIGLEVEMDELRSDISNPSLTQAQRKAAQDQLARCQETLHAKRWEGQGGRFVSSLSDALEREKKDGTITFDQQVVRTLAKEAAFAIQHDDPNDEVGKKLLFNQNESAKKARDAIIARAAESGIDWYQPGKATQPNVPLIEYDEKTGAVSAADEALLRRIAGADPAAQEALLKRVRRDDMTMSVEDVYRAANLNPDGTRPTAP